MKTNKSILRWVFYLLPIPAIVLSIFVGPAADINWLEFIHHLFTQGDSEEYVLVRSIVMDIRLPRILLVFLTGSVLSVSGAAFQAIFRNPLVDPYILGLSAGAAFGAALGLSTAILPVQMSAFVFGLLAVGISYFMALKHGQINIVSLILAGIITNGLFTALLTIVQVFSDPFKLQSIVHWMMGNFQHAGWTSFWSALPGASVGLIVLFFLRWKLNVLAMGDREAETTGTNAKRLKWWVLIAATLSGSAVVAVSGIIGLYGLLIPHAVRMVFGVDNRTTLIFNATLGGSFLVFIDDLSRTLTSFEIPIGVFTMLIGAPFFIWLLKKSNIGWEQ